MKNNIKLCSGVIIVLKDTTVSFWIIVNTQRKYGIFHSLFSCRKILGFLCNIDNIHIILLGDIDFVDKILLNICENKEINYKRVRSVFVILVDGTETQRRCNIPFVEANIQSRSETSIFYTINSIDVMMDLVELIATFLLVNFMVDLCSNLLEIL